MTLIDDIIKLIVSDILSGINILIIVWVILRFVKHNILPEVPKWIHDINMALLERNAVRKAQGAV